MSNLSTKVKNMKLRFLTIVEKKVTTSFKSLFYSEEVYVIFRPFHLREVL